MAHVPAVSRTRSSHRLRVRETHSADAFEPVVQGHEEPQKQESIDASFGTQNFQEGSVTLDKLRLQDEFGSTILSPSGFVGSWEDFVNTSLYNGSFGDNRAGTAPLGRTAMVPYWTLEDLVGTNEWGSVPGYVQFRSTTASNKGRLTSDLIRVRMGVTLGLSLTGFNPDLFASVATVTLKVLEYDQTGTLQTTNPIATRTYTGGGADGNRVYGSFKPNSSLAALSSDPTVFIKVVVEITATTLSAGTCSFALFEVDVWLAERAHGDVFPTAPAHNEHFYRDDLEMEFYYDVNATKWLSTQLFQVQFDYLQNISATSTDVIRAPVGRMPGSSDIWIEQCRLDGHHVADGTNLSASHKWTIVFKKLAATSGTLTTIATIAIDSGADGIWRPKATPVDVDALLDGGTEHVLYSVSANKTGTPGNLFIYPTLTYRIVAT
jgi:hypothetical protein